MSLLSSGPKNGHLPASSSRRAYLVAWLSCGRVSRGCKSESDCLLRGSDGVGARRQAQPGRPATSRMAARPTPAPRVLRGPVAAVGTTVENANAAGTPAPRRKWARRHRDRPDHRQHAASNVDAGGAAGTVLRYVREAGDAELCEPCAEAVLDAADEDELP